MQKIGVLSMALIMFGCMTNKYGGDSQAAKTAAVTSDKSQMCEDTCAGVITNPDLLGCVLACSHFQAHKVLVNVGKSLYTDTQTAPACQFTYEKRDADRVQIGAYYEAFSFALTFSTGIGDGSFYPVGSGLVGSNQTIDFTKDMDQKETGDTDEGGASTLTFSRINPAYGNLPTFAATGTDITGENKTLTIVLAQDFNPQHPFDKIVSVNYQSKLGDSTKYDVVCQP